MKAQVGLCDPCNSADFRRTDLFHGAVAPKVALCSLFCSEIGLNLGAETCTQSVFLAGGGTCPYKEGSMFHGGVCI